MRRSMLLGIAFVLLLIILAGCNKRVTGDEKTAEQYVQAKGYKITSYKGEVEKYNFDKSKVFGSTETIQYQQAWSVQNVEPDKYFGKEITVYGFTVSNHPLEKKYNSPTYVSIMLCEGKVVGGISFPENKGKVVQLGALYSLDGKTLEEVTGTTFKEWSKKWKEKYGNQQKT
jgi:hypothetical protein